MTKSVAATCTAGVVTIDSMPVPGAVILSAGVGSSSGTAFIDGDKVYYVANTTPDLKTLLEKVISLLTELTTVLTLIDAKPTGGVGSATTPVAAAAVVNLTALSVQLTTLNGILK
jgi:hypothetical protein